LSRVSLALKRIKISELTVLVIKHRAVEALKLVKIVDLAAGPAEFAVTYDAVTQL
jgi:hypothetical protein